MATAPVPSAPAAPATPTREPAGFHLPSYLLGLITALTLLGGALLLWPRPQPAALQLRPPPTPAATPTSVPTAEPTPRPTPGPLVVFVSGAVTQPGLYTLAPTARIGDAIAAAGGLLPGVNPALVNQAQQLIDGAQVHIPEPALAAQDAQAPPAGLRVAIPLALPTPTVQGDTVLQPNPATAPAASPALAERAANVDLPAAGGLINVNTATSAELESLPGIGPTKAQAIIANRPFAGVEDLDRVPGIGPATIEQIRPYITIQ